MVTRQRKTSAQVWSLLSSVLKAIEILCQIIWTLWEDNLFAVVLAHEQQDIQSAYGY